MGTRFLKCGNMRNRPKRFVRGGDRNGLAPILCDECLNHGLFSFYQEA